MTTLIKNGTIVTAGDTYRADLLIDDGVIALIGRDLPEGNAAVIDAANAGAHAFVGGVHEGESVGGIFGDGQADGGALHASPCVGCGTIHVHEVGIVAGFFMV